MEIKKKVFLLTLKVPQANTFPSEVRAAVWQSPAVICIIFAGNSTSPTVKLSSSHDVSLPSAPSSLQPQLNTC